MFKKPLTEPQYFYLQGCVRQEEDYPVPEFKVNHDQPLVYVGFRSVGSGDTKTLQRIINDLGRQPVKVLVNVGDYIDQFTRVPDNVQLGSWFPQPSVISQAEAVSVWPDPGR